jgi:Transposase DDE domain
VPLALLRRRTRLRQLTVLLGRHCNGHRVRHRGAQLVVADGHHKPRVFGEERGRIKNAARISPKDTPAGRALYSRRMATVEPVFANLQNKGMRRFTLRGARR